MTNIESSKELGVSLREVMVGGEDGIRGRGRPRGVKEGRGRRKTSVSESTSDIDYLDKYIFPPLQQALSQLIKIKPCNPIPFLVDLLLSAELADEAEKENIFNQQPPSPPLIVIDNISSNGPDLVIKHSDEIASDGRKQNRGRVGTRRIIIPAEGSPLPAVVPPERRSKEHYSVLSAKALELLIEVASTVDINPVVISILKEKLKDVNVYKPMENNKWRCTWFEEDQMPRKVWTRLFKKWQKNDFVKIRTQGPIWIWNEDFLRKTNCIPFSPTPT